MLDYELFSPQHDIDAEIRYSYIHLQSFGDTSEVVQGQADAENLSSDGASGADWSDAVIQAPALCAGRGAHRVFR